MEDSYDGGCQCGKLRYRVVGAPLTLYACHCTECQKQSSSAFGMSLWVRRDALRLLAGKPMFWERPADSGGRVVCAFCPDCGTRVYHAASPDSETVSLKAGSLDDTSWLDPVGHVWTRSAQPWVEIDRSAPGLVFEEQPANFEEFVRRWEPGVRRS
jgi:hypothetical protein